MSTPPPCVSRVPIFAGLSLAEQLEVHELARPRRVAGGDVLYAEAHGASSLFVVNRGGLRLSRSNRDGAEHLLRVLGPGDFVGITPFLTGSPADHTATATGSTELCEFRHADLPALLERFPQIGAAMLGALAEQLARTEDRLVAQTLEPVERRVADYLLALPTGPDPRGLRLTLPMSKKDVASYLGTSPESFSRSLRALARAGVIETDGARDVVVLDSFALSALGSDG